MNTSTTSQIADTYTLHDITGNHPKAKMRYAVLRKMAIQFATGLHTITWEDLLQDILIALNTRLCKYNPEKHKGVPYDAWIYMIARSHFIIKQRTYAQAQQRYTPISSFKQNGHSDDTTGDPIEDTMFQSLDALNAFEPALREMIAGFEQYLYQVSSNPHNRLRAQGKVPNIIAVYRMMCHTLPEIDDTIFGAELRMKDLVQRIHENLHISTTAIYNITLRIRRHAVAYFNLPQTLLDKKPKAIMQDLKDKPEKESITAQPLMSISAIQEHKAVYGKSR